MEQMKFEMGDLQQTAPKRVKKRQLPGESCGCFCWRFWRCWQWWWSSSCWTAPPLTVCAAASPTCARKRTRAAAPGSTSITGTAPGATRIWTAACWWPPAVRLRCWMIRGTPSTTRHCKGARWLSARRMASARCMRSAERACTCWMPRAL